MLIICGIKPGKSGTGVVMSHLIREASHFKPGKVKFLFGWAGGPGILALLRQSMIVSAVVTLLERIKDKLTLRSQLLLPSTLSEKTVILAHPQTLGFKNVIDFLDRRTEPVWLFLMDSSFFCIRSYNHLTDENEACLRCLGGNFSHIDSFGCLPFPVKDKYARHFLSKLRDYVFAGKVKLITQTKGQADLAYKHFGAQATVKVGGIWGENWDVQDYKKNNHGDIKSYDVVYHGSSHEAKGIKWVINLARLLPDRQFLIPARHIKLNDPLAGLPSNCIITALTWDCGLRDAVKSAKIVILPSLWSAPVEGALIKSVGLANAVAVVENPTAFSSEVPKDVVLHLSPDIRKAAVELEDALVTGWKPSLKTRNKWYNTFSLSNRNLLDSLLKVAEA